MADIKDRIISLRIEKRMTQGQLAEALKISPSSIGMYEQGRRKPSYELLEEISDYFNVDMDYLMGRSDIKNKYQAGLKYDWEDELRETGKISPKKEEVKTAARNRKIVNKLDKLSETKRKLVEDLINSYFDEDMEDEE